MTDADIAIVGAGAGGLAAGIFAGEALKATGRRMTVVALDGARKVGAKILVAGGGRCNVTHRRVTPDDYAGGPKPLIRRVLKAFGVEATRAWMADMGVELKLEETGKYFPVSDDAQTVLDGLLHRLGSVGVDLRTGSRVERIRPADEGWELALREGGTLRARRVIVATGGLALPKSGSDGAGLEMLRELGHTVVPTTPALVPLVLAAGPEPGGRFADFAGLTLDVAIGLYSTSGKRLAGETASLLFTHFGVSGPAPMDLSRHWLRHRLEHPDEPVRLCIGHPGLTSPEAADEWLRQQAAQHGKRELATVLREKLPDRLARVLADNAGTLATLGKPQRRRTARWLTRLELPVVRDRGYKHAETTAGGVSLEEVDVATMESKRHPGLHLCGEVLDVDGRIGGFSFQWAWSSGYLAGRAAADGLL